MQDVLIVLGDRPDRGVPTDEMRRRIAAAAELAGSGRYSMLLLSGGRTEGVHSEAHLMHRILEEDYMDLCIPAVLETSSLDTIGNAYFSALILSRISFGAATVVTGPRHAQRAGYIFGKVMGERAKVESYSPPSVASGAGEDAAMELAVALLEDLRPWDMHTLGERIRSMHPYYSGEVTG